MARLKIIAVALLAVFCQTGAGWGPLAHVFGPPTEPDTTTVRELGLDAECHTDENAGYPREISKLAHPSNTCSYYGYYVGGNCLLKRHGGGPGPLQGTYGWDYSGKCFHRNVILHFCYRCKYYQGIGSYDPDKGPKVPNVFGLKLKEHPEGEQPPLTDCRGGEARDCNNKKCAPNCNASALTPSAAPAQVEKVSYSDAPRETRRSVFSELSRLGSERRTMAK